MSDKTPEAMLVDQLDDVLRQANEAADEQREVQRDLDVKRRRSSDLEARAQRIRLALFALRGEDKSAGNANSANHERRQELRREAGR